MVSRRQFGIGAAAMAGDGLVPPLNAPGAQQPTPGVQPGASGVVVANRVIVVGAGGGVFVYSGTPAPGNPPIFWATSGTQDPYGNALPSTAGIAGTGTFQAGDTIITPAGTFVYSSTPALGNLISSQAGAAGFDSAGNEYLAGNVGYTYIPAEPAYYAVVSSSNGIAVYRATTQAGPWSAMGGLVYFAGTNKGIQLYDQASGASLTMLDAVDGAGNIFGALAGVLSLYPAIGTPTPTPAGNALVYADAAGIPRTVNANDGDAYSLGAQILVASSDTTINSTNPIQVNGLTTSVGVGMYKVAGSLRVVAAGSGTAQAFQFQFNGTSTVLSAMRVRTRAYHEAAGVSMNAGTISGLASSGGNTGTMVNSSVFSVDFEGLFTVSTAGTFHVDGQQATSASDETFTVQALSWMELTPK